MNQVPTVIPNLAAGIAGGAIVGGAVFLALFSVVLLVPIILIVANRAEPDQRGLRPLSVYLFGMSFVTLQLTFAGSVLIVTALFSVIAPHDSPLTNSVARQVVIGALLVVLAGATLLLHLGRGIETARGDGALTGPNLRVMHSYAAVVGFIYFLQLIFALGTAVVPRVRAGGAWRVGQHRVEPERHGGAAARPRLRDAGVGIHRGGPLGHRTLGAAAGTRVDSARSGSSVPTSGSPWSVSTPSARRVNQRRGAHSAAMAARTSSRAARRAGHVAAINPSTAARSRKITRLL